MTTKDQILWECNCKIDEVHYHLDPIPGVAAAFKAVPVSAFILNLPKPHDILEALESVLPDDISNFSPTNQQRLKSLYDQINSQIAIPRIKEPEVGEEITARHMELASAVERLKEKPCAMIRSRFEMGSPWYDLDCKKRFSWSELEEPELAQVSE
jgi:hypothetical protein